MNRNKILFLLMLTVIVIIVIYSFQGGESNDDYVKRIHEERIEKDEFMKNDEESPFEAEAKQIFRGLNYFPASPEYKVNAKLDMLENNELITLPMNDGTEENYIKYAYATFNLLGKNHQLLLLKRKDEEVDNSLFLAFSDKTSGNETYGGGRYIDLELRSKNFVTIDFNKAYNPFCEYNYRYTCPLPPKENQMDIPVEAGEKVYGPS